MKPPRIERIERIGHGHGRFILATYDGQRDKTLTLFKRWISCFFFGQKFPVFNPAAPGGCSVSLFLTATVTVMTWLLLFAQTL
jgi:hypothetical protein